ncbi:MAG: hypothetical protein OEY89_11290 [Gammaproteobacteria bacterium]|nr:hypothetical protein [Gammaproteobacteria bacterium]
MTKYVVVFNKIIEADSEEDAKYEFSQNIACMTDDEDIQCFEYNNAPHPFDGDVTFQELIGKD